MAEQSFQPSSSQPEQSQGGEHIVSSADQVVSGSVRHESESDSQTEQALRETKSEQTGEGQVSCGAVAFDFICIRKRGHEGPHISGEDGEYGVVVWRSGKDQQ